MIPPHSLATVSGCWVQTHTSPFMRRWKRGFMHQSLCSWYLAQNQGPTISAHSVEMGQKAWDPLPRKGPSSLHFFISYSHTPLHFLWRNSVGWSTHPLEMILVWIQIMPSFIQQRSMWSKHQVPENVCSDQKHQRPNPWQGAHRQVGERGKKTKDYTKI